MSREEPQGYENLCYQDRLVILNLPSLLYRRRRMDMIVVYKIVHGLDSIHFEDIFTRSYGYKLFKHHSHLNNRKYTFSQRIIIDWNGIL